MLYLFSYFVVLLRNKIMDNGQPDVIILGFILQY